MYKRSGQISPLGDALQGMLREHEIQEPLRPHIARAIWAEVVGPEIAAATIAETVRGGVVFVRVKSNVWANELTFLKQDILDRLNRRLGAKILTDIHFKTTGRALKAAVAPPAIQEEPDDEELRQIQPTGPLVDFTKRRTAISDPDADRRLRTVLTKVAQTQTWKRQHGWITCAACGALYYRQPGTDIDNRFCPFCITVRQVTQTHP